VWGVGGDQDLWDFPVSNIDFDKVTTDLKALQTLAENSACGGGEDCYWKQRGLGYHIVFLANGTFNLYRVNKLENPIWGYDGEDWKREADDIDEESLEGNYIIPQNCGIIMVEDDLWIEGTVKGKVTVAAARFPATGNTPKIIINGDLKYLAKDGSSVLGIISQSHIYVPLYAAKDNLEIDGALMAQNGHVFRKHYCRGGSCSHDVPQEARGYILRNSISLYGSIITNTTWTWTWVNGSGQTISGYRNTSTTYDPNLIYNPPPGFPGTGEYQILRWEETTEKQ
jgi:hypothetical protein